MYLPRKAPSVGFLRFSPIGWRNSPASAGAGQPAGSHRWRSPKATCDFITGEGHHDDPPFFGHMKNLVGNIVLILMVNFNDYDDG